MFFTLVLLVFILLRELECGRSRSVQNKARRLREGVAGFAIHTQAWSRPESREEGLHHKSEGHHTQGPSLTVIESNQGISLT